MATTASGQLMAVAALCLVAGTAAQAAGVPNQGTWETTLLGRDVHRQPVAAGSAAAVYLYDTVLNVTWLRSAPAAAFAGWAEADDWATSLVTGAGAEAVTDWRLPGMHVANPAGIGSITYDGSSAQGYNAPGSSSEWASLFYDTLGNRSAYNPDGTPHPAGAGLSNSGSFLNLVSYPYWMGTDRGFTLAGRDVKWLFDTRDGLQWYSVEEATIRALAVRAGDVTTAVPEPASALMLWLGLAMGALVWGPNRPQRPLQARQQ